MFQISVKNCNPPWEKLPALCQQHSSKNLDPLKPPIFKNMVGGLNPPSPPPPPPPPTSAETGRGANYGIKVKKINVVSINSYQNFSGLHSFNIWFLLWAPPVIS